MYDSKSRTLANIFNAVLVKNESEITYYIFRKHLF